MLRCVMIHVRDVDQSAAFFEKVFGVPRHCMTSGPREIVFDTGNTLVSFVEHVWTEEPSNAPVVLSMTGYDLEKMMYTFWKMGAKIVEGPTGNKNLQYVVADSGLGFFVQVVDSFPRAFLQIPPRPAQ